MNREITSDGGPAFPLQAHADEAKSRYYLTQQGMTLRDYFAAAIMQGLMESQCEVTDEPYPIYAYKIADAMLKARSAK